MLTALRTILILSLIFSLPTRVSAIDTAVATLTISGNVPTIFSLAARGVPGDLDLSPSVIVNNRLLGILHFKYNADVDTLTISSSTTTGKPEDSANTAYPFGASGFKVAIAAGCSSVNTTYNAAFALTATGTNIVSAAAGALTTGVEEDCELNATWAGSTSAVPLAGKYSMTITVTMVSL